ncbi:hypothetical protein PT974_00943 [Cladobotryum mycophilum]|uniref:Zn(2)-C6 fungal-type domain-containing protein n=1 Tax=Cladobotryum mycophilum TaxID=491253 RepID=A0ABR0T2B1_9HYPO
MSGSPPLPLKIAHEVNSRGEPSSLFAASRPQDGYRSSPVQPPLTHLRDPPTPAYPMSRSYPPEQSHGAAYSYPRNDESNRLTSYSLQPPHAFPQGPAHQSYIPAASSNSADNYPILSRPTAIESQPYTSPKSQRKTKGHVASACVPCKRAHLRCDAQRPCSRCLGNGKEDACIDVQHKKRGRPRLRDERDTRFDPTRFPHTQDPLRRPLSIFPSGAPGPSGYDDPLRRASSFRSLESRPGDLTSRPYLDRAPAPDATFYNPVLPSGSRSFEPLAYLNMELEVIRASPTFVDGVRIANIQGRKFSELVAPSQANLVYAIRDQFINEQRSKEPNYLPPIIGRVDNVVQELGFAADDVARFPLDRQEYFSFIGTDEFTRTFPVRLGLAKRESHYFVVVLLNFQPLPSPSQHPREQQPMSYHHQPTPPQSVLSEHAPNAASFDPRRHRLSDSSIRSPLGLSSSSSSINSGAPAYPPTMNRPDYPSPSAYQIPRSDVPPTNRTPTSHSFQLPPIRAQSDQRPPSREPGLLRDERSGRVDIGGLIDKPALSGRQW